MKTIKRHDTRWEQHQPIWGKSVEGEGYRDQSIAGCVACDWRRPEDWDSLAAFAEHAKTVGAPDYMVTYWNDWATHVEAPTGTLNRDAVARELFDYGVVMEEASKVYEELAGLSKPNTAAHHVISGAEHKYRFEHADLILHDLLPLIDGDEAKRAVIDFAEGLHEGIWEETQRAKVAMAGLLAAREANKASA